MQAGLLQQHLTSDFLCAVLTCRPDDSFNVYTPAIIDSTIVVHTHAETLRQLPTANRSISSHGLRRCSTRVRVECA
jgi:hypothetical protein